MPLASRDLPKENNCKLTKPKPLPFPYISGRLRRASETGVSDLSEPTTKDQSPSRKGSNKKDLVPLEPRARKAVAIQPWRQVWIKLVATCQDFDHH